MIKSGWVCFTSAKYIRSGKRKRLTATFVLSSLGIAVGVAALITVLSVMNGFQMGFIEDILEISSCHIRIEGISEAEAAEVREMKGVESVMLFAESQGLAGGAGGIFPCMLKGLPDNAGMLDPGFFRQLAITRGGLWGPGGNGIVIGRNMAYRLGAGIGDKVSLVMLSGAAFSALSPEAAEYTVTGIFNSGYEDFDSALVIMPLEKLRESDETAGLVYGIKLADRFRDAFYASALAAAYPEADVSSWREYNKSFFGALRLEKTAMFLLLGLIFLVVSFSIHNSTRRSVAERREDIGIMRAMGARPAQIRRIFVFNGLAVGLAGGAAGLAAGMALTLNINSVISLMSFRTAAFLTNVPVRIVPQEVALILAAAIIFCAGAAITASGRVSGIMPQEVLRYE